MTTFIDDVFNEKKQTVAETITEQEIELCPRVPHSTRATSSSTTHSSSVWPHW